MKAYEMTEAPRYELAKELGADRPFLLPAPAATIKDQDSLRTKGVLALQKLVAEQWGEIPAETMPLPEIQGLRDLLLQAQRQDSVASEHINYL